MAIEPIFESITVGGKQGAVCDRIEVDCKTELPVSIIGKIINVSSSTAVRETESKNGCIKYSGNTNFFICYEDIEGNLKKAECGGEFNGEIKADYINEGSHAQLIVLSEKTEADNSGIKLALSSKVSVCATIYGDRAFSALAGGESVVTDTKSLPIFKILNKKQGTYPVEEEFELHCAIDEVLCQNAKAHVTAVQCGVGCVIIDGEVNFTAILLQSGEKNDIIRENRKIPFRAEIECEEAMPTCYATASVCKKSFKTDITVDDESSKSAINLSVLLDFSCEVFTEEEISVVCDAFSTAENLKIEREKFTCYKNLEQRCCTARVSGRVKIPEELEGANLIAVCGESAETVSFERCDEGTKVIGTVEVFALFRNAENKVVSERFESSFESLLECVFPEETEIEIFALVENANLQLITMSEGEIQADLVFTVYPKERCTVEYISGVESLGERAKNTSAISVYIPLEGEELWSLAKRLGVSPDELLQTNSDLQFPLCGEERIVIYRQK